MTQGDIVLISGTRVMHLRWAWWQSMGTKLHWAVDIASQYQFTTRKPKGLWHSCHHDRLCDPITRLLATTASIRHWRWNNATATTRFALQ